MRKLFLVSACLVGARTRYDGEARLHPELLQLLQEGRAVPICPEQLGGLTTPPSSGGDSRR